MGQEVVIVDNNGDEHHFPPGFDPHKAAEIVQRGAREGSVQSQTNQRFSAAKEVGDTINGRDPARPSMIDDLFTMLGHAAQPESMGDFLSLIIPSASGIGGVRSGLTLPQKAGPIAGTAIAATGRGVRKIGEGLRAPANVGGLLSAGSNPVKAAAIMATPPALRGTGRILEGIGGFLKRPDPLFKMESVPTKLGEVIDPFAPAGGAMEGEFTEVARKALPQAPPAGVGAAPGARPGLPGGRPPITQPAQRMNPNTPALGEGVVRTGPDTAGSRKLLGEGRTIEAQPSSIEDKLSQMSDDVVNYSNPDKQPALDVRRTDKTPYTADGRTTTSEAGAAPHGPQGGPAQSADAAEDAILEAAGRGDLPSQPLGKPRVLSWKSGQGPSDELVQTTREAEGSKGAARRLGLSQAQIKSRSTSTGALPTAAQSRITQAMEGMSAEEKLAYLESAPNGVSAEFIKSIMGQ